MKYEVIEWEDDNDKKFKSILAFSKDKGINDIRLMTIQNDSSHEDCLNMMQDIQIFNSIVKRLKERGELK